LPGSSATQKETGQAFSISNTQEEKRKPKMTEAALKLRAEIEAGLKQDFTSDDIREVQSLCEPLITMEQLQRFNDTYQKVFNARTENS